MDSETEAPNTPVRGTFMRTRSMWWMTVAMLALFLRAAQSQQTNPPYKNSSLPLDERVKDLLGRMTLEEKVAQLQSTWQSSSFLTPQTSPQTAALYKAQLFVDGNGKLNPEKAKLLLKDGLGEFSRPSEAVAG